MVPSPNFNESGRHLSAKFWYASEGESLLPLTG